MRRCRGHTHETFRVHSDARANAKASCQGMCQFAEIRKDKNRERLVCFVWSARAPRNGSAEWQHHGATHQWHSMRGPKARPLMDASHLADAYAKPYLGTLSDGIWGPRRTSTKSSHPVTQQCACPRDVVALPWLASQVVAPLPDCKQRVPDKSTEHVRDTKGDTFTTQHVESKDGVMAREHSRTRVSDTWRTNTQGCDGDKLLHRDVQLKGHNIIASNRTCSPPEAAPNHPPNIHPL